MNYFLQISEIYSFCTEKHCQKNCNGRVLKRQIVIVTGIIKEIVLKQIGFLFKYDKLDLSGVLAPTLTGILNIFPTAG